MQKYQCQICKREYPSVIMARFAGIYECIKCVSRNDDIAQYEFVESAMCFIRGAKP